MIESRKPTPYLVERKVMILGRVFEWEIRYSNTPLGQLKYKHGNLNLEAPGTAIPLLKAKAFRALCEASSVVFDDCLHV